VNGHTEDQTIYEAPTVVDYGDLTALTAGSRDGEWLDSDYPAGTQKSALGFSGPGS
jgi:hypothetical protein